MLMFLLMHFGSINQFLGWQICSIGFLTTLWILQTSELLKIKKYCNIKVTGAKIYRE